MGLLKLLVCAVFGFAFFFFNDTATTEIYTLSLHDALPISGSKRGTHLSLSLERLEALVSQPLTRVGLRSEEHTSELQSPCNLVCRLLLEKKKKVIRPPVIADARAIPAIRYALPCLALVSSI